MNLRTLRTHHCPACCSLLVLDESVTVQSVGDCPVCRTNVRFNNIYIVQDMTHAKPLKFDKDAAIKRFNEKEESFVPSEKPKQPREYKCSNCGETGHNARSCGKDMATQPESPPPEPEPEPEPSPASPWNDREYKVVKTHIKEARGKPCHTGTMATHYDLPEELISRICEHLVENVRGFRTRTDAEGYYFFDKGQVT